MTRLHTLAVLIVVGTTATAQELTPKQFLSASWALLDNPTGEDVADIAKAIIGFTSETKDATVMLGEPEMKWVGGDKKCQLVLTGAYAAGNVQSQLNSGVVRNDRNAGVITLLAAYRKIQEKDKKFKIEAVEELLMLHKDDKLVANLVELGKKKPMN